MDLVSIEEIRRLKHRYLRCVDLKLWDDLTDTFTPEATACYGTLAYGGKPLKLTGRDEIIAFLRKNLGPDIITTHFATQPEIDVDGDTATGMWCFEDTVIATAYRLVIRGSAFYEDRYARRADGSRRIAHTGYERTYGATLPLDDLPSFRLTTNRRAPQPGAVPPAQEPS